MSALLYYCLRSFSASFACFLSGVFLDIDHVIDYWLHEGINFNIKGLFKWSEDRNWRFLILILHSLEFLVVFWILVSVLKLGPFWFGLAIGFSLHMILDLIYNTKTMYGYTYLFSYRVIKGFKGEYFHRREDV